MPKLTAIANELDALSVNDLNDLIPQLENMWGVVAKPEPVAVIMEIVDKVEEKTSWGIHLTSFGANKIAVIKVIRELTALPLREAKELVDKAPVVLVDEADETQCATFKEKLEAAGAKVEIK